MVMQCYLNLVWKEGEKTRKKMKDKLSIVGG